jgi:hypothetical protein
VARIEIDSRVPPCYNQHYWPNIRQRIPPARFSDLISMGSTSPKPGTRKPQVRDLSTAIAVCGCDQQATLVVGMASQSSALEQRGMKGGARTGRTL